MNAGYLKFRVYDFAAKAAKWIDGDDIAFSETLMFRVAIPVRGAPLSTTFTCPIDGYVARIVGICDTAGAPGTTWQLRHTNGAGDDMGTVTADTIGRDESLGAVTRVSVNGGDTLHVSASDTASIGYMLIEVMRY